METSYQPRHHTLRLEERKTLEITGVKQIESFDAQEFLLETTLGHLHIKGSGLTLGKMDTDQGELLIRGTIDSISYAGKKVQADGKKGFAKRLFK